MFVEPNIAAVAALVGEPRRAAMLDALAGGAALAAGELAARAGVRPQTASAHLARLVNGGLVNVERAGRRRMYRLSGPLAARLLELLSLIAPRSPVSSLRHAEAAKTLRAARTCYDHLAGRLGVALTEAFVKQRWLLPCGRDFRLTRNGERVLSAIGVDVAGARAARRAFARKCLDWSERRHHLAGALGASLARRLIDLNWIARAREHRGVRLTPAGRAAFAERFHVPSAWDRDV